MIPDTQMESKLPAQVVAPPSQMDAAGMGIRRAAIMQRLGMRNARGFGAPRRKMFDMKNAERSPVFEVASPRADDALGARQGGFGLGMIRGGAYA